MKGLAIPLVAAAALAMAAVGCGKKQATQLTVASKQAFDSATPELKEMWTQALEADRTNDYYRAEVLLYELIRQNPPQEQVAAAREELVLVHHRLQDGVAKGDPAAQAAFDEIRKNPPNRPIGGAQ